MNDELKLNERDDARDENVEIEMVIENVEEIIKEDNLP